MGPGLTRNFVVVGKSSQNSPDVLEYYTMCILSVYTLLKVVGYYDLSVLSMSVMGFQKKVLMGGWALSTFFRIFFLLCKAPKGIFFCCRSQQTYARSVWLRRPAYPPHL